jgi:signal peptidase I
MPRRQRSLLRLIAEPILLAIVLALIVRTALFRIYAIPSPSMTPTLQVGDHIVVTPFGDDAPARGDVVVFRSPVDEDELMVKRMIATAGDLVESRSGRIAIGGHTLAEPYLRDAAASGMIAPQIVPAGCYFVMGDNRANSYDSRSWGVLPAERVVGRVRLVLWSSGDGSTQPSAHAASRVDSLLPVRAASGFHRFFSSVR